MARIWSFTTIAHLAVIFSITDFYGAWSKSPLNHVTATGATDSDRPEIRIPQGSLRGMNMVSRRNRKIFRFEGIPFAQPPVGELRFKSPLAPEPWNGTFDASRAASKCPQITGSGKIVGEEDCLVLNVYTPRVTENQNMLTEYYSRFQGLPKVENSTLLPVMVFIYGGGFNVGTIDSGLFGPDYLLDKDVLLVLPNYRLGVLGFLSTGDEVSPGNYGLKDIVRALEWIQDNIQYFGGDPNRVTLFGHSAGAHAIHFLSLSNVTNGLFHKYITHSGTGLSVTTLDSSTISKNRAFQLGKHLGCPTNSSGILVDCFRGLTVSQLVNTTWLFQKWKIIPPHVWVPTIEPHVEGALLTQHPVDLVLAGKSRDLPWLAGCTREDGISLTAPFYRNSDSAREFFDSIDSTLPYVMKYDDKVENKEYWTSALKKYYLNDLTTITDELLRNLTYLIGDVTMTYPILSGLQQHLLVAKQPQYMYSFEYEGTFRYSYLFTGSLNNYGVAHGDDILYLFRCRYPNFGPPEYQNNENDWKMVDIMIELWTSFATTGTPSTSIFNGTKIWEPFSSRDNYLQIGNGPEVTLENKSGFLTARMQFCKELFDNATWV